MKDNPMLLPLIILITAYIGFCIWCCLYGVVDFHEFCERMISWLI